MSPPQAAVRRHPELLAGIAGVLVVLLIFAVVHESATSPRSSATAARRAATAPGRSGADHGHPVRRLFPQTPTGAAQAATTYLIAMSGVLEQSPQSARRTLDAVTSGPLHAELVRVLPQVVIRIRSRLASSSAPAQFDGFPLAYRVDSFTPRVATVSLWHLDVASSPALRLTVTDYTTTTYTLSWIAESWRISAITNTVGPTPPPPGSAVARIDSFARAANAFSRYTYGP